MKLRTPVPRKADVVADDLLRAIVAGRIEVGTLLPKEAELAGAYGVNRGVVREAIKLLEVHRLVRPKRRRGTEVLSPLASLSPEVLRAMIQPAPGRIDRRILADLLEVRAGLDMQMVGLAAERRTEADLAEIERHLAAVTAAVGDPAGYERAGDGLSRAVGRATGNRIFEMLVRWNEMVARELGLVFRAARPASPAHAQGLRMLVDCIRARDAAAARTLVATFHEWATPRLLDAATLSTGGPLEPAPDGESEEEAGG